MKIIHRSCCAIRRGFTFIEALTVASGVSVLLALLVPAVQNARDSERDVLCLNRLKQLGLALHNYHDSHLTFPPGWVSRRPDAGGYSSTGWHNQILPYVNQGKLYSVIGPRDGLRIPTNEQRTLLQTAVVEFRCNSDSVGEMNPLRGDWGTTNYMGNFGPQPIPRWSESDFWPGQINNLKMALLNNTFLESLTSTVPLTSAKLRMVPRKHFWLANVPSSGAAGSGQDRVLTFTKAMLWPTAAMRPH